MSPANKSSLARVMFFVGLGIFTHVQFDSWRDWLSWGVGYALMTLALDILIPRPPEATP